MITETIRFPFHVRALLLAARVALVLLGIVGYALDATKRITARVWAWLPVLVLAGCLAPFIAGPVAGLAACSQLTPAVGTFLQGADNLACSALAEVPVVGGLIAMACPGEEAAVASALAHAEAQLAPGDGGATPKPTATLDVHVDAGSLGPPLYRHGRVIGRCPCGYPAERVAMAQAAIDGQDGGR